jgi:predicted enzyme related to lactoylglutathione lyase
MSNPFVHLELNTPDLPKAKEFYSSLFGWSFEDMPMGPGMTYSTFKPASGPGGGMMTVEGAPTMWLAYVGVKDIHADTEKAVSLGAKVIRGPQEVPGHGWMTILLDPAGAAIALWQPTTPMA